MLALLKASRQRRLYLWKQEVRKVIRALEASRRKVIDVVARLLGQLSYELTSGKTVRDQK